MAKKNGSKNGNGKANGKVNKSQAIRDALARDANASPKQISAELTSAGIAVSSAFVSVVKMTMKSKSKKRRKSQSMKVRSKPQAGMFNESDLVKMKQAIDSVGGIANAESLLGTLKRIL